MNFPRAYTLRFLAKPLKGLAGIGRAGTSAIKTGAIRTGAIRTGAIRTGAIRMGVIGLGLAGCQTMQPMRPPANPLHAPTLVHAAPKAPLHIAALLPLSGPNAELGREFLAAAQLALDSPDAPILDVHDTGGTREGAAHAARAAVAHHDTLVIGPLTARETAAVSPITQMAHIPVLAFTNDPKQARIGVWTLGITPGQQVHRLMEAAEMHGAQRPAAVLPETAFGDGLAHAYQHMPVGAPPTSIRRYTDQAGAVAALHALVDASGQLQCDTLMLAESGQRLQALEPVLSNLHLNAPQVRLMGPDLWAKENGDSPALAGAWYAAPDPALRQDFEQQYLSRYHNAPTHLADLAYDAASLARVLAESADFSLASLERRSGFAGVDGVFVLMSDGHVKRGLAVFELGQAGGRIVEASPTDPGQASSF
jgi:branched-chain amino acid transport system substrate-binding protein